MPDLKFPLTGDRLTDITIAVVFLIIGAAVALKADKKWGWVFVGLALFWAYKLFWGIAG